MINKFVIIVAGGSGKRMNSEIPKQFLEINEKPVLMHTFKRFLHYSTNLFFILVLPENHINLWKQLCLLHKFEIPHTITKGGTERFYSVQNALQEINSTGLVAIHDGVRPLVSIDTISRCFDKAEKLGNAVPVTDISESMRYVDEKGNVPVNRNKYKLVQTPQVFNSEIIINAYKQIYNQKFTDDASVVENFGIKINLVEGNSENIKITRPIDIKIAQILL